MAPAPRCCQVGVHDTLPRRLMAAIVEWAFPLPPGESTSRRNWDVLGKFLATQAMGHSKVLLVGGPGFEMKVSPITLWNLASRIRIPIAMVFKLMVVPPPLCCVQSIVLTNVALPALKPVLCFMTLSPIRRLEYPVAIWLSAREICCFGWI